MQTHRYVWRDGERWRQIGYEITLVQDSLDSQSRNAEQTRMTYESMLHEVLTPFRSVVSSLILDGTFFDLAAY